MTPEERAAALVEDNGCDAIIAGYRLDDRSHPPNLVKEDVVAVIAAAIRAAEEAMRERCAAECEAMVIGGRMWNHEQQVAADALMTAAKNVRALPIGGAK